MKKKFNVNEYVWVKLGDKGIDIYLRSFDCIPKEIRERERIPHLPEVDEEGYSKLQMFPAFSETSRQSRMNSLCGSVHFMLLMGL